MVSKQSLLLVGANGYIGSFLKPYLEELYDVYTLDILGQADYRFFMWSGQNPFDIIVYVAGHSSVPMCRDWEQTYNNSVVNLNTYVRNLKPHQKLIYASSASVCNGIMNATEADPLYAPENAYDTSKQMMELLANGSGKTTFGLRFGTVCGVSPNQRMDLIIAKMAWNAVHNKEVKIFNAKSMRSILGLYDLRDSIVAICKKGTEENSGIYNLASFDMSIEELGKRIANYYNASYSVLEGTGTYSFTLNTDKIKQVFDVDLFESIEFILEQFSTEFLKGIKPGDFDRYERRYAAFNYVK